MNDHKFSAQVKAKVVRLFIETRSVSLVQRQFRTQYGKENTIRNWTRKFNEADGVHDRPCSGRPKLPDACHLLHSNIGWRSSALQEAVFMQDGAPTTSDRMFRRIS